MCLRCLQSGQIGALSVLTAKVRAYLTTTTPAPYRTLLPWHTHTHAAGSALFSDCGTEDARLCFFEGPPLPYYLIMPLSGQPMAHIIHAVTARGPIRDGVGGVFFPVYHKSPLIFMTHQHHHHHRELAAWSVCAGTATNGGREEP